ncbi:MAG: MltA domain-containing protein [Hyphomicrobiaceae bacterium]
MTLPDFRYEPVPFADLLGWADDDHWAAFVAFSASAHVVGGAVGRAEASASGVVTADQARIFFEAHFRPHRVVQTRARGLLTGYYEPVIAGSLERTAQFTVPIYQRPGDLENVVAESERGAKSSGLTHVRRTARGVEPYATRREIEEGALAGLGLELCYLVDPVDAFFLQVQGSGVIALPDGRLMRVTYDGKNGHPYMSVGRVLIDEGVFAADQVTLQRLTDWLRADPERARPVLWRNESFVFFRALEGDHAVGVLGTPLHEGRSLAIDTAFHALGLPIYAVAPGMAHVGPDGLRRLMVAHDVGSAIKGPERGDVYFGTGDAAFVLAGVTKHPVTFFVLLPVEP